MRLITQRTLDRFAVAHPAVRQALADWQSMVRGARWRNGDEVVRSSTFPARALPGNRLIFNIKGNDYRLVCSIQYADESNGLNGIVRVQFIGTHAEYDRIDARAVEY